jgi:energy-coupling factor transporter ATP-binding protein EcfA2
MPEPDTTHVADRLRRLEAFKAQTEDRLEVVEARRTTWLPSQSWENLSGRQREIAYIACLLVALWLTNRLARPRV